MKFSREYEASIIPEWKGAFVDYKRLKKLVKKIKIARLDEDDSTTAPSDADALVPAGEREGDSGGGYGFFVFDPALVSRSAPSVRASTVRNFSVKRSSSCTDKKIKVTCRIEDDSAAPSNADAIVAAGEDDYDPPSTTTFSDCDFYSLRASTARSFSLERSESSDSLGELDKHEREFLERADEELEKVNTFYAAKEAELLGRGEALIKQLHILVDVKRILADHAAPRRAPSLLERRRSKRVAPLPELRRSGRLGSAHIISNQPTSRLSNGSAEADEVMAEGAEVAEEVMASLERNGVSFRGLPGRKHAAALQMPSTPSTVRIDIPATNPGRAALKAWEELVNVLLKEGVKSAAAFVHRRKIQHAEKNIRDAFMALHRGLQLLNKFSSLNVKAFTKILKKFVKVSEQHSATDLFSQKVKRSSFSTSDKVLELVDEVESLFIKHFAGNDRMVAMKYLKPQHPKSRHMTTFLIGLFTGTFVSLFTIYAYLAHFSGFFGSAGNTANMQVVHHVFSLFALISIHCFVYGCNLYMWRRTRINHNFIFDFAPNTALTPRDAFLMSASIMCTVVVALVINLFLRNAGASYSNVVPRALIVFSAGLLLCPFNVFYRSTRYCFMRVLRNIVLSPLYKVVMADFFMADQLTSQVPLLRHMEFTACYFVAGSFRANPHETCTNNQHYKNLAYVISFLPYYWRVVQSIRRYLEEGHDRDQLSNASKHISTMVAAAFRFKYSATPTPFWMGMVLISSLGATVYQLYWDFVKDWGFFTPKSRNRWLRDELVLKNKSIYYVSMVLNLVLRLAWTESVVKILVSKDETRVLDFSLASLEIIRRGQWNFYRLENEHLNNVGKFRAVKTVPLPFHELEN